MFVKVAEVTNIRDKDLNEFKKMLVDNGYSYVLDDDYDNDIIVIKDSNKQ